jgi:hypothetical protein
VPYCVCTNLFANIIFDVLFHFRQRWSKQWSNAHADSGALPLRHAMLARRCQAIAPHTHTPTAQYFVHTQSSPQLSTQRCINGAFVREIHGKRHFAIDVIKHFVDVARITSVTIIAASITQSLKGSQRAHVIIRGIVSRSQMQMYETIRRRERFCQQFKPRAVDVKCTSHSHSVEQILLRDGTKRMRFSLSRFDKQLCKESVTGRQSPLLVPESLMSVDESRLSVHESQVHINNSRES